MVEVPIRSRDRFTPRALASGMAGALVLTGLHEIARRTVPHAPRMDVIGERALAGTIRAAGGNPPRGRRLFRSTLAGEILSNTLYYSVVGAGVGSRVWRKGLVAGLTAGLGAVLLPPRLGLGRQPGESRPLTPLLTVAWYTAGGLAAAMTARLLQGKGAAPA
jgi:hypothetical protein